MRLLAYLLLLCFASGIHAEFVVVGHKNNPATLDITLVEDIFMGRVHYLDDGQTVTAVDQVPLRAEFYLKVTGRPLEQIDAYWARIMFTGQNSPPKLLADDEAVLKTINENPNAIGYMNKKNINNTVRILFNFTE
jgi:ABC-type phosphate transport system substrate-binding protein